MLSEDRPSDEGQFQEIDTSGRKISITMSSFLMSCLACLHLEVSIMAKGYALYRLRWVVTAIRIWLPLIYLDHCDYEASKPNGWFADKFLADRFRPCCTIGLRHLYWSVMLYWYIKLYIKLQLESAYSLTGKKTLMTYSDYRRSLLSNGVILSGYRSTSFRAVQIYVMNDITENLLLMKTVLHMCTNCSRWFA